MVALVVESKPQGWFRDFTSQPTNASLQAGPQHLANVSSSSRWLWWKEAWHAWEAQPWRGTGAGTFDLTHRLLRTNNIVVTEPHNVPLQFLSETGVVGLLPRARRRSRAAAVGVARRLRGREPAVVALAVLAAAYVLHSLVDFDWDFVAVTGAVPPLGRRAARRAGGAGRAADRVVAAAGGRGRRGRALAADAVVRGALDRLGARRRSRTGGRCVAYRDARDARSLNPLALDPLLVQAEALEQLGDFQGARQRYIDAVELQPLNWRAWFELGSFERASRTSAARSRRSSARSSSTRSTRSPRPARRPRRAGSSTAVSQPARARSQICVQKGASRR